MRGNIDRVLAQRKAASTKIGKVKQCHQPKKSYSNLNWRTARLSVYSSGSRPGLKPHMTNRSWAAKRLRRPCLVAGQISLTWGLRDTVFPVISSEDFFSVTIRREVKRAWTCTLTGR